MLNKLKQMIKQAVISMVTDDSSAYPQGQASYNGKTTPFTRLSPYGLDTNPPNNSSVILLSSQGQESVKYGIISDLINRRKNLKEGETNLNNLLAGNYIYLQEDGTIKILSTNNVSVEAPGDVSVDAGGDISAVSGGSITAEASSSAEVTAPIITLNGNVTVNGTFSQAGGGASSFSGTVTDGTGINLGTHVHSGVQSGGSNTGGPL